MKVEDLIIRLSKIAKLCPKAEVVLRADGSDLFDAVTTVEAEDVVRTESGNIIVPWKPGLATRKAIQIS